MKRPVLKGVVGCIHLSVSLCRKTLSDWLSVFHVMIDKGIMMFDALGAKGMSNVCAFFVFFHHIWLFPSIVHGADALADTAYRHHLLSLPSYSSR